MTLPSSISSLIAGRRHAIACLAGALLLCLCLMVGSGTGDDSDVGVISITPHGRLPSTTAAAPPPTRTEATAEVPALRSTTTPVGRSGHHGPSCALILKDVLVDLDPLPAAGVKSRVSTLRRAALEPCRSPERLRGWAPSPIMPLKVTTAVRQHFQFPAVHVNVAVFAGVDSCISNLWHGWNDVILPTLAAAAVASQGRSLAHLPRSPVRFGANQRKGRADASGSVTWSTQGIILVLSFPPDKVWNGQCDVYRRHPFGFRGDSSPTAFFVEHVLDGVVFFDAKNRPLVPELDVPAVVAKVAAIGGNGSCASPFPPLAEAPYFLDPDPRDPCFVAQQHFHRVLQLSASRIRHADLVSSLRAAAASAADPAERTAEGELSLVDGRFPPAQLLVVYWDRAVVNDASRKSGRVLLNRAAVMDTLRTACGKFRSVRNVTFLMVAPEALTRSQQLAVAHRANVFIAPRGAGTVFQAALEDGAGVISLFPWRPTRAVSGPNDNFPWWPFRHTRPELWFRAVPCAAQPPVNATAEAVLRCTNRSDNFCDMHCPVAAVQAAVHDVLTSSVAFAHLDGPVTPTGMLSAIPPATTALWRFPLLDCVEKDGGGRRRCGYRAEDPAEDNLLADGRFRLHNQLNDEAGAS